MGSKRRRRGTLVSSPPLTLTEVGVGEAVRQSRRDNVIRDQNADCQIRLNMLPLSYWHTRKSKSNGNAQLSNYSTSTRTLHCNYFTYGTGTGTIITGKNISPNLKQSSDSTEDRLTPWEGDALVRQNHSSYTNSEFATSVKAHTLNDDNNSDLKNHVRGLIRTSKSHRSLHLSILILVILQPSLGTSTARKHL